jgi:hypothetical protein
MLCREVTPIPPERLFGTCSTTAVQFLLNHLTHLEHTGLLTFVMKVPNFNLSGGSLSLLKDFYFQHSLQVNGGAVRPLYFSPLPLKSMHHC